MSKNKTVIKIENPLPGGSNYTNPRRAHYFIATGQAQFVAPYLIRFVPPDRQAQEIRAEVRLSQSISPPLLNPSDISAGGIATLAQIAGVPVISPLKLIREGSDRYSPRAAKRGIVRLLDVKADLWKGEQEVLCAV